MSGRVLILWLVIGVVSYPSAFLFAGECTNNGHFYESNHYIVTKVHVEAPLIIASTLKKFRDGNGLSIHAHSNQTAGGQKGVFDYIEFLESASQIGSALGNGYKVSFAYVIPLLRDCDENAKTLQVVYRVYHVGYPGVPSVGALTLAPAFIRIGNSDLSTLFSVQPSIGYDAARHFFGGGQAEFRRKSNGLFNVLSVSGYGSSSSLLLQANVSGSKDWATGAISHFEWGLNYVSNDIPTGLYSVSEKQLAIRFSGIARPVDSSSWTIHFGASVAGGNQQSAGPIVPAPVGVASSPVGALKLYVGSAWNNGPASLTTSYGIQLGNSQPAVGLDFIKQIANVAGSMRFLPVDHHPLMVDGEFRAGWITSYGTIPLAERFFGGNISTPFIPGDSWVVQGNPLIRSFPANNLVFANGPWGGTKFISVNTNISYAVWGRPLVPTNVASEFEPGLQGEMKTFKQVLTDTYVADSQSFKDLETAIAGNSGALAELQQHLNKIKTQVGISSDAASAVDTSLDDLNSVNSQIQVLGKRDASVDPLIPVIQLVVGGVGGWKGYVSDLADDLATLQQALTSPSQDEDRRFIASSEQELRKLRSNAFTQYQTLDTALASAKAESSLKFPAHVLSELLHSINLYSISPTLLFDIARLGPQMSGGDLGTQYGLGPAIRFGLVNVDFTLGYSFNIKQGPGLPRGATVVGLTFENIF
jgi:hypothetical protein